MFTKRLIPALFLLVCTSTLTGCDLSSLGVAERNGTRVQIIQSAHYRNLLEIYDSFSYDLDNLDQGVPPLVLRRFPTDMHLIKPVSRKKDFFFQAILPMALLGNEEIRNQRRTVKNLLETHDRGEPLLLHQYEELNDIQQYYRVEGDVLDDPAARKILLRRIDTIPPSLILAQAANESGWGMSRFAQHANNIFGEWTFTPGTGLVPEERPEGATYEVRRFKDLYSSIRSYLQNLNTHNAYQEMRKTRQRLRQNGLPVTGYTLAGDLRFYSTRRDAYVEEIRAIIVGNRLQDMNRLSLLPEANVTETEEKPPKGGLMSTQEEMSRRSKS